MPQRGSVDWDFPDQRARCRHDGHAMAGWAGSGAPANGQREFAMRCLEQVGMADFANRQISQLSGGQQQRVFLARALAQDAELYFMDEPFAGSTPPPSRRSSTCCGSCARAARRSSAFITIWSPPPTTSTGWCCSTCA